MSTPISPLPASKKHNTPYVNTEHLANENHVRSCKAAFNEFQKFFKLMWRAD